MLIVDHVDSGYVSITVVALFSSETQVTSFHVSYLSSRDDVLCGCGDGSRGTSFQLNTAQISD